jgi:hypothetical protein
MGRLLATSNNSFSTARERDRGILRQWEKNVLSVALLRLRAFSSPFLVCRDLAPFRLRKPFFRGCLLAIACLTVLLGAAPAAGQDAGAELDEFEGMLLEDVRVYVYPEIEPEVTLSTGFRFTDQGGAASATEYERLGSTPVLGGEVRLFGYPHRAHLDIAVNNDKDYFGDVRYAYGDTVVLRGLARSVYHNMPTLELADLDPLTETASVDIRDAGAEYGTASAVQQYSLRVKPFPYAMHGFFTAWSFEREGLAQVRYMGGSGTYNDLVRVSDEREIDYTVRRYEAGLNGHLGPMEAEYAHLWKTFDAGGDSTLTDYYGSSAYRDAGEYAHHTTPDVTGSDDTLRLHTMYTGQLAGSMTLSRSEATNDDLGATADRLRGAGGVTWMPRTDLVFTIRYTHTDLDMDAPSMVTVEDLADASTALSYSSSPAVDSSRDTVSAVGRYHPIPSLTLKALYRYEGVDRGGEDWDEAWGLPEDGSEHEAGAEARLRLGRKMTAQARYSYLWTVDPAYNTTPDAEHRSEASLSFSPLPEVSGLLLYGLTFGERADLTYDDGTEAEDRETRQETAMGTCTFVMDARTTLTLLYAYIAYDIAQDIVYGTAGGDALMEPLVQLADRADVYGATLAYMPRPQVDLTFGVTHTLARGNWTPEGEDLGGDPSVAEYSAYESAETAFSLAAAYRLPEGYEVGAEYVYSTLSDLLRNEYDDIEDGSAHVAVLTVKKKW